MFGIGGPNWYPLAGPRRGPFYSIGSPPLLINGPPLPNDPFFIKNPSKIETPPKGAKSQFLMPLGLPLGVQNVPKSTKSASGRPPECDVSKKHKNSNISGLSKPAKLSSRYSESSIFTYSLHPQKMPNMSTFNLLLEAFLPPKSPKVPSWRVPKKRQKMMSNIL